MKNQRKKRFIDSAVQGALVRRILTHWFIFFAIVMLVLPVWQVMYATGFSKPLSSLLVDSLAESAPVFIILFAMLPLFVWDTVKFSHRFAGPMYRISKAVRGLVEGEEFRPIKLRKGDFWEDCANDLNVLVERWTSQETQEAPAAANPVAVVTTGQAELPTETGQI